MLVTRLWLRHQSRKVQIVREGSFAGRNLGFVCTEVRQGKHGHLPGTSVFEFFESDSGSSCYASTRRWMRTTNACMLNSNAKCRENMVDDASIADTISNAKCRENIVDDASIADTISDYVHAKAEKCDVLVVQNIATKATSSISNEKDMGSHVMSKSSSPQKARKSADAADEGMQDTTLMHGGNLLGSEAVASGEDSDAEIGEESVEPGTCHQNLDRSTLTSHQKKTANELRTLLEEKGWTESTRKVFLSAKNSKGLSLQAFSLIILWQKDLALASSVFEWVCEHMGHDVSVYHAYLKVLGEAKHFDKMLDYVAKMKNSGMEVSFITFCVMIKACRVAGEPSMAIEVFKIAPEYGIESSISLYQALLSTLFLLNLVKEARLLYSRTIQEGLSFDIHTFNTLIYGFGLTSGIEDAKKSFESILKAGIEPDLSSYNALVSAYCNVHALDSAIAVLTQIKESGLIGSTSAMNIVVEALCKMGNIDGAINLIASVQTWCLPNMYTFINLIDALFSARKISKALSLFQVMEDEGLTNEWAYINLSKGLRHCLQTKEIRIMLKGLFAKYGFGNVHVCNALLHNLISLNEVDEAERLFEGMLGAIREPNLSTFATMIHFYCSLEMPDRALLLFAQLKDRGFKHNMSCCSSIISTLLKASRVVDAMKCFREMLDYGYQSNEFTCDYLLRELCINAMTADVPEVLKIILRNKYTLQAPTLVQLVKCMCKEGKVEETNIIFRSLYERRCLSLHKVAAKQALSVMKVMSN